MVANFITSFDNISRLCGPKINFMSSSFILYYNKYLSLAFSDRTSDKV